MPQHLTRFPTRTPCRRALLLLGGLLLLAYPASASAQSGVMNLAALSDSAAAHLERGDVAGARSRYEQVLEAEPDHLEGLVGMGRVWLADRVGAERALEVLRKATAKHPTSPKAHYWRALAHLRLAETDLGRDNATSARRELETALELDPSHGDARYQLAKLLRTIYEDYTAAAEIFRQQVAANPGHLDARFELLKAEMDLGEWRRAIAAGEELLERDPDYLDAYPYLAGAYWRGDQSQEAMGVFERYFGRLDEREQGLYLDMGIILTPREREEFESLDAQGRRAYWGRYWRTRDPDPQTDVNERLLEHYIRIAYARIRFGENTWPWDARGDFYVRYGEPDMRSGRGMPVAWDLVDDDPTFLNRKRDYQEQMGMSSSYQRRTPFDSSTWEPPAMIPKSFVVDIAVAIQDRTDPSGVDPSRMSLDDIWDLASQLAEERYMRNLASATPERWVYSERGIDVSFDDPVHSGKYLVAGDRSRMLVERMEAKAPVISEEEEKIELIDPMDSVVTFKGEDGKTRVEYAFALLPDEFGAFRSTTGTFATLDVEVALYTPDWKPVEEAVQPRRRLQTVPQVRIRDIPLFVDATRLDVDPGEYILTTLLLDPVSGRRASAEEEVQIPDYSTGELMFSDILPAALIREATPQSDPKFVRGDLEVLPLPGRTLQTDQPLYVYYELYNLSKDPIGATDWEIAYSVAEAQEERGAASRLYQGLKSLVGAGQERAVITSTVSASGIRNDERAYLQIDLSALPAGTYELVLTATDTHDGRTAAARLLFRTIPGR